LKNELPFIRENLQATVEELETSNNELQSTNEDLNSVNEELATVHAEFQRKIVKSTELTDVIENLLRSTEIGAFSGPRVAFLTRRRRHFCPPPEEKKAPVSPSQRRCALAHLLAGRSVFLATTVSTHRRTVGA